LVLLDRFCLFLLVFVSVMRYCTSCLLATLLAQADARIWDFEADVKAVAGNRLYDKHNGAKMNETLAQLAPGDVFVIPNKTFHVMGGIQATGLRDVTIQIDGTLAFSENTKAWPTSNEQGNVLECLEFWDFENVTFTSSGDKGTLDGHGHKWWGIPGIGYLIREENRPRLMRIHNGRNILIENILFKNSPYWTLTANVDGLEIRNSDIDARRTDHDGHGIIDMTAFNTDGFDVTGKNVWIHDCNVWNQDDTVCVKDNSENMLFERINASGVGLTIGSIGGGSTVRNITFRDCYMHNTFKGIYLKFRGSANDEAALVADVTYENIVMDSPEQVPIWIGPAQQSDSREFWKGHPCSLFWPQLPGSNCDVPALGSYINITLRNITINNPKQGPGLIYGNETNPMQNIIFDNVVVNNPGNKPWGTDYFCKNAQGVATGNTNPVPPCFEDRTDRTLKTTLV